LKKFLEAAKPTLNIHGHLHTTNHNVEKLGDTDVYCVSILDENYEIAFEPQYFELKDD
jgi:Icc-related predicted phosphoesterase